MKNLIVLFLLLLLSIWLGLEMSRGTGYVLIVYRHWTVETTLWVSLICLIVLFALLYFTFRTLGRATRISKNIRRWQRMHRFRKGRRLTTLGLCELAEGEWHSAESTLLKAAKLSKGPLINYLSAAEAANAEQAYERRDNHLRQAHRSTKGSGIAIGLTQAQLQIDSGQWEQACATLQHLNHINPHHAYTLKMLKTVYLQLQDWQKLQLLIKSLRKYKVESVTSLDKLEKNIYDHLLTSANSKSIEALLDTWKTLPRHYQHDTAMLSKYVRYLLHHHEDNKARQLIEQTLKKQWDAQLVLLYRNTRGNSADKQLQHAEMWLKKYPKEPELLLCAGQLSLREKFFGKASAYLNDSIQVSPSAAAYQALAQVHEAQGEQQQALICYQRGLELTTL